ncbi:hypothetical protein MNBD_GAMMA01-528 [hydrothermal vent metagenome]|uniref:Methyltransferase type 11 domain-containing protein n=1 Tax=hydrothermal vent metagenome TaxID=652676 RepID=A0A3B0V9W6_9ZZZZ
MAEENILEFTGERFTPQCVREIWYEHYHRYAFAKRLVADKNVLDIACGEGYGSDILAQYAKTVVGIDIDDASVTHAKTQYSRNNLTYIAGSCLDIPLDDASINVVVSFETLEHLAQQQEMLAEINRVLTSDGLLIISTPDKKYYSDATGFANEFHVKELYKDEFKQLLDRHWKEQIWYSQALSFNSIMEKFGDKQQTYSSDILNDSNSFIEDDPLIKPMYYIVIATKAKQFLPSLPALHLFADTEQSIYGHYNAVIRAHILYENKYRKLKSKYNKLKSQHNKWLSIPILGRIIKHFSLKF